MFTLNDKSMLNDQMIDQLFLIVNSTPFILLFIKCSRGSLHSASRTLGTFIITQDAYFKILGTPFRYSDGNKYRMRPRRFLQ